MAVGTVAEEEVADIVAGGEVVDNAVEEVAGIVAEEVAVDAAVEVAVDAAVAPVVAVEALVVGQVE